MLFEIRETAVERLASIWRWPHFGVGKLACHCDGRFCQGEYWHDTTFLDQLEDMRARIGKPLRINSGHRCDLWNAAVGGAPLSQHKTIAADVALYGQDRFAVLRAARQTGFTGLGLARNFIQVDRRVRPAIWYYQGSEPLWQTS